MFCAMKLHVDMVFLTDWKSSSFPIMVHTLNTVSNDSFLIDALLLSWAIFILCIYIVDVVS